MGDEKCQGQTREDHDLPLMGLVESGALGNAGEEPHTTNIIKTVPLRAGLEDSPISSVFSGPCTNRSSPIPLADEQNDGRYF